MLPESLFCGAISGAVTYVCSSSIPAALVCAGVAAVLTWFFGPTVFVGDD